MMELFTWQRMRLSLRAKRGNLINNKNRLLRRFTPRNEYASVPRFFANGIIPSHDKSRQKSDVGRFQKQPVVKKEYETLSDTH
jgi:hypothetical protein